MRASTLILRGVAVDTRAWDPGRPWPHAQRHDHPSSHPWSIKVALGSGRVAGEAVTDSVTL